MIFVIYDQIGFFCSSRVWFTFSYYNFKSIKILNGGIKYWKENNYVLSRQKKTSLKKQIIELIEKKRWWLTKNMLRRKSMIKIL